MWQDDPFKEYDGKTNDNRPYYIPLPLNWNQIKHFNTKNIEDNLEAFCKKRAIQTFIKRPRAKKPSNPQVESIESVLFRL